MKQVHYKSDVVIRARAPLRLGLAGGGTDVSPYCDVHGGYVLNATIDRYAYANLSILNNSEYVRFIAADRRQERVLPLRGVFESNGILDLHLAVYKYFIQNYNEGEPIALELLTFCDAPPGSGLGSSSALVVSMIRAFVTLLNLPLDNFAIAQLAYKIERIDCRLAGGRQDQYAASFGGINFIEFYEDDQVLIKPLEIEKQTIYELESSLVLFFTGVSRDSASIILDQCDQLKSGSSDAIEAMHGIKHEALIMRDALLCADWGKFIDSLERGWTHKKNASKKITNTHIEDIYNAAKNAGALAGKVSGAGGGGFMLFYVPTPFRMDVIRALEQFKGQVSNCHFTQKGCHSWNP